MACQLPATYGIPLSRWSCPELAVEVVAAGIAPAMSASTVRRILGRDAIKPWQYRSWISIRDPDFAAKAKRVLDLYARTWEGQPLGDDEYVISSDEKTPSRPGAAATRPCHPESRARCASSTSTTEAGRWPTWLPTTSTGRT